MGKNDSFKVIYLVIYSFHMPLFAFISGVFARFSPEKIRNHLIYPFGFSDPLSAFCQQRAGKGGEEGSPRQRLWYLNISKVSNGLRILIV